VATQRQRPEGEADSISRGLVRNTTTLLSSPLSSSPLLLLAGLAPTSFRRSGTERRSSLVVQRAGTLTGWWGPWRWWRSWVVVDDPASPRPSHLAPLTSHLSPSHRASFSRAGPVGCPVECPVAGPVESVGEALVLRMRCTYLEVLDGAAATTSG
jgi:hypothetical protein